MYAEPGRLDRRFSRHGTACLTDAIITQRYIELNGQLQRIMAVVKVRGSADSKDLRTFEVTEQGIVMGETLGGYEGLLTGSPGSIPSGPSDQRQLTRSHDVGNGRPDGDMSDANPPAKTPSQRVMKRHPSD